MSLRKRPHSVRMRLTLTYVGAMLVVLAVYAVVVYVSVHGSMSQALDAKLRDDFKWPNYMMTEEMVRQLVRGEVSFEETGGEGSPWLQVWSEDGKEILGRTYEARRNPIPDSVKLAGTADEKIRTLSEMIPPYRILTGKTRVGGVSLVVQVAESEGSMRTYLRQLFLVLLLGLPLGVAIAGLGGYTLARGALAPV